VESDRDYFLVRQSDAHAVAEVWLEGRAGRVSIRPRWSRPSGCAAGSSTCCPMRWRHASAAAQLSWLTRALRRWDAANAWWSDHVVKFDYSAQLDLLGRFGIRLPDARYLGWPSCSRCSGGSRSSPAHRPQRTPRPRPTRWRAPYTRLCHKLRASVRRAPHQGR